MIDGQGIEIEALFMKKEWPGMLVCGISVGDKSCVGIRDEFHSDYTRMHAHVYGFGTNDTVSG